MHKNKEALAMYGKALVIHCNSVMKAVNPECGRPLLVLPGCQDQLAHTLFCIAEVREVMGEHDDALRIYGESKWS